MGPTVRHGPSAKKKKKTEKKKTSQNTKPTTTNKTPKDTKGSVSTWVHPEARKAGGVPAPRANSFLLWADLSPKTAWLKGSLWLYGSSRTRSPPFKGCPRKARAAELFTPMKQLYLSEAKFPGLGSGVTPSTLPAPLGSVGAHFDPDPFAG